ncbi:DUF4917 family protein [Xenorhabdus sp. XENO-1]|uniref:DUF4917 family protein n=1 Tax=Xenorhabdus bovienii TaxID=40576 RepID=UPI0020CA4D90|nr:DUF4917 family protein [Xenorhabdus bovienii subsp. africana]
MSLSTFEEKLKEACECYSPNSISILLGNGFSQGWDKDIFNYKILKEKANFGDRYTIIDNIFTKFETFDFEKVMAALESAEKICSEYCVDKSIIDNIKEDQEKLKNSLIDVITRTHPPRSSSVTIDQFIKARAFLAHFSNVFTLNYDLLLYWIINKIEVDTYEYRHSDGFYRDTWALEPNGTPNIFFLHGGLHLYNEGLFVKKHTYRNSNDISIIDQVRDNLEQGKFPLFVSEPTHQKKLQRIENNLYLRHGYLKLAEIEEVLFIHGHSIAENDRHIFDQIKKSTVLEKVFVGIFGDENSEENRKSITNANRFIQSQHISVEFYDAASAPIW